MFQVFREMPWPLWVYFGIGLVVAFWYQRRQGHPEQEHGSRTQLFVLMMLSWLWPVILLAALANPPDKPKVTNETKEPPPKP